MMKSYFIKNIDKMAGKYSPSFSRQAANILEGPHKVLDACKDCSTSVVQYTANILNDYQ